MLMYIVCKTLLCQVATLAALSLVVPAARAQSGSFDFDTDSVGTSTTIVPTSLQTPFTDTSGGITGTFSTPTDTTLGGYHIQNLPLDPPGMSGNILETGTTNNAPLTVAFDHTLRQGSVTYFNRGVIFTVQELLNGVVVGTVASTNQSGTLAFDGTSFNSLVLGSAETSFLADNFNVSAAPEPSQFAAFAVGLLGLGALAIRARKRRTA